MVSATLSEAAVLVIDDESDARQTLVRLLEMIGCSALSASSGPEALQLLKTGAKVDLILADVVMPGMDGLEFAALARAMRPCLPVVMVTGDANAADAVIAAGTLALIKPYSLETLGRVMADALVSDAGNTLS